MAFSSSSSPSSSSIALVPSEGVPDTFLTSVVENLTARHPFAFSGSLSSPTASHVVVRAPTADVEGFSVVTFVSREDPAPPAVLDVDPAGGVATIACSPSASSPAAVASVLLDVVMQFAHSRTETGSSSSSPFPVPASGAESSVPLPDVGPFVTVANIRRPLASLVSDPTELRVGAGVGQIGDIVVGDVRPFAPPPLHIHDPSRELVLCHGPSVRVMAALGNRSSSTHANGGVPDGGLPIEMGGKTEPLVWLTGSSGLIGKLYSDPSYDTKSPAFHTVGLLQYSDSHPTRPGQNVNVLDLAVKPESTTLTTPIVIISGTSAEAGKSTMTSLLVKTMTERCGMKVATVKATGTGGIGDTSMHRAAGAVVSYDQVDAGMPTTYIDADTFQSRIRTSMLAAQDSGADVVVVELGGDIIWANNPALLAMPDVLAVVDKVLVICNDALSALGVMTFVKDSLPDLAASDKLALVCSPFRSVAGMAARAGVLGTPAMLDPNSADDLMSVLSCCAGKTAAPAGK